MKPPAPDKCDIVWISFSPQLGHEQAGRRPSLILTPRYYNEDSGLCLCCPISSKVKGYPFEVKLPAGLIVGGVVISDQVKSFDWVARQAEYICSAPEHVVLETLENVYALFGD